MYQADGIHIDMGIGKYSVVSKEKVRNFASHRVLKCYEVNLKGIYSTSVTYIVRKNNRSYCSTCGSIKGFSHKAKPLCRIINEETTKYCDIKGIDYISERYPLSKKDQSLIYKELLNQLETYSPGSKA